MSLDRKPSSPLIDALKLFFLNKSSVVALLLILGLAVAAVSGELLTGKAPTPQQFDQMEEAKILGDVFDSDANSWAVVDPNKTDLKNKLLAPGSDSDDGDKYYFMGTDHLGRDVAAQLWAGSSISLTIGFLAVSISILLGVSLGGVAGFYGRSHVRLPFFLTFLFVLVGGIAMPLEATLFGQICFAAAGLLMALQTGLAIQGKRYAPVIGFMVILVVSGGLYLFNGYHETETPEGKGLQQARNLHSVADDLLMGIRDLGRARNTEEAGEKDALSLEELTKMQLRLEVDTRRFAIHKSMAKLINVGVGVEKEARGAQEQIDRAAHLEDNTSEMKDPGKEASETSKKKFKRNEKWQTAAEDLRKSGDATLKITENTLPAVQDYLPTAAASIESALEACVLSEDMDTKSEDAQTQLMLDTWVLTQNAEQAVARLKAIVSLSQIKGFKLPTDEFKGDAIKNKLNSRIWESLKKQANDALKAAAAGKSKLNDEKKIAALTKLIDALNKDLKAQKPAIESLKKAQKKLAAVKGDKAKAEHEKAESAVTSNETALEGKITAIYGQLEKKFSSDELALLKGARKSAIALASLDEGIVESKVKVEKRISGKGLTESDKKKIEEFGNYDYTKKDELPKDIFYFTLEPSHKLLDRRANHRGELNSLKSSAQNLFDSNRGILSAKMLDNSYRYGTYRLTRHFITFSIMVLLLIVSAALVAAAAQGAAEDMRYTGLGRIFVRTITVDDMIMRFTEIMMTIPVLFLMLAVLAMFGNDVYIVMAIIGLTSWMGTTRFVRAEILSLREQDFVQAARALGVKDYRIIWRHLVPNAISPVLVSATLMVASAVLAESTLSFLGIGAKEGQNTWGYILSNGRKFITDAPWLTWIPGVAILVTVLSFNLLGEGLREAFNPKLRGR